MRAILFAAAIALTACAPAAVKPPPGAVQENAALSLTPNTRTILTGDAAASLTHQCSRVSPGPVGGAWTPGAADLDLLEAQLATVLANELATIHPNASPGDYYRQYAGFIIGGKRIIYVAGFHRSLLDHPNPDHPFDWRTQAMSVCDGGPIMFGVEYDPATHAFSHFEFNGAI
jgi:hypothetical protein